MEKVYLAGKISGDPEFKEKFMTAQHELERAGFIVLNPAWLPQSGFTYEAYMRIGNAMLLECDAICLLPDWRESHGAMIEYDQATKHQKRIFLYKYWIKEYKKHPAPLRCRILHKFASPSPSAIMLNCFMGLKLKIKKCEYCENNQKDWSLGFEKGFYEANAATYSLRECLRQFGEVVSRQQCAVPDENDDIEDRY